MLCSGVIEALKWNPKRFAFRNILIISPERKLKVLEESPGKSKLREFLK